ncbi:nicotinate-nucleotide pyrophosphorylase (carboxylating) [Halothece sp. PCC 7418]|uniref:carboxylating nicotinate-nucleotide diphosphorylase n=1 Tax=Halothece sp. (strain PCC 7418) TaxID=65093 RepID=UPI0002A0684A|nr:carboxylating nicotinate-nucleotide diphosphorylase [Halothece sp. PCC 7418]AFZ45240.1 nicotinate-nucleotide pyrophosphorylase (carboxylating) [Halothece sp. PCC 7418]
MTLPPNILIEPLLQDWLREDIGRGDRATSALIEPTLIPQEAVWIAKQPGIIAGLPIAEKIFRLLGEIVWHPQVSEGESCHQQQEILRCRAQPNTLLTGERVALNLVMHLSGIATLTRSYVDKIADLPTQLVDTRKTTPGLRVLEKYATQLGGAVNHRFGLDDSAMIKENHIQVAGGVKNAIAQVRSQLPYPLTIEVETTTQAEVEAALTTEVDIIMLDNMSPQLMSEMVQLIRRSGKAIKIEASGNITLETIREVAETGVDYISTSAPITQAKWLDLSMKLL